MPDLQKISNLEREIDILLQFRKRIDLAIEELCALRPRQRKKKSEYVVIEGLKGKKLRFKA